MSSLHKAANLLVLFLWVVAVHCAPKGHLQPLGNHRPADIPIDEYDGPLDPDRFYKDYVVPFKPVVFRGAARQSPAFELWTDEYLTRQYGDMELRLEEKAEGEAESLPAGALGIGRDIMSNFISHYRSSNGYIVSELPSPMFKDIAVPPSMACSVLQHKIQEVNLWLSAKGAYSKIHRDAFNAINCLLNGTKDWFFIDKKYDKEVYVVHKSKWEAGGMSLVEPRRVDLKRFPKFANVHYSFVTINAGDCLYVPGGVYHQVHSYGDKNLAVSFLFSQHARKVHSRGCEDGVLRYKLLNESNVIWPYSGSGVMRMGSLDVDFFHSLMENFTLLNGNRLTPDVVHETILDLSAPTEGFEKTGLAEEEKEQLRETAQAVFDRINVDKKPFLTTEDLDRVSVEEWKAITVTIEPADISNTYDAEYSVIDKQMVVSGVRRFLKKSLQMSRKDFLNIYTKKAHGSVYIGNKIFDKLDKKKKGHLTRKEMNKRLFAELEGLFGEQEHFETVNSNEEDLIRSFAHRGGQGDDEEGDHDPRMEEEEDGQDNEGEEGDDDGDTGDEDDDGAQRRAPPEQSRREEL